MAWIKREDARMYAKHAMGEARRGAGWLGLGPAVKGGGMGCEYGLERTEPLPAFLRWGKQMGVVVGIV